MQKQEVAFTAWLNHVLMPVHATATAREAAGMSPSTLVCSVSIFPAIFSAQAAA